MFSASRVLRLRFNTSPSLNTICNRFLHSSSSTTYAQQLPTRHVSIRTSQPLHKLSERRCLLAALQRFGEIASFAAVRDADKFGHTIRAMYDTPEAAVKAIDASPLTVLLPASFDADAHAYTSFQSFRGTAEGDRYIKCDIELAEIVGHEEHDLSYQPARNGNRNTNRKNSPGRDPRIADIIQAGVPRREFAECILTEDIYAYGPEQGDEYSMTESEELISKGSLMVLKKK